LTVVSVLVASAAPAGETPVLIAMTPAQLKASVLNVMETSTLGRRLVNCYEIT
jgi:hypothetical protein